MTTSNLIFTVVPNPAHDSPLRLTVLVTPRLVAPAAESTLGNFVFGPLPWPQRVDQLSYRGVRFDGAPPVPAVLAAPDRDVEARDAALWTSLFPATRRVRSYVFDDHQQRQLRS